MEDEPTLNDLVDRLVQRRVWIAVTLVAALALAGYSSYGNTPNPIYEGEATVLTLSHTTVVANWLRSQAAQNAVVEEVGMAAGSAIVQDGGDGLITVRVRNGASGDAAAAPAALLSTLSAVEPTVRALIWQNAFDTFYQGHNEDDARRLADERSATAVIWLEPSPTVVRDITQYPNPTLNFSLAVVAGLMLGVFIALMADWYSSYRGKRN